MSRLPSISTTDAECAIMKRINEAVSWVYYAGATTISTETGESEASAYFLHIQQQTSLTARLKREEVHKPGEQHGRVRDHPRDQAEHEPGNYEHLQPFVQPTFANSPLTTAIVARKTLFTYSPSDTINQLST
jgi:hypothetical protein